MAFERFSLDLTVADTYLNVRIRAVSLGVNRGQVSAPLDAHFQRSKPVVVEQRELHLPTNGDVAPGALASA